MADKKAITNAMLLEAKTAYQQPTSWERPWWTQVRGSSSHLKLLSELVAFCQRVFILNLKAPWEKTVDNPLASLGQVCIVIKGLKHLMSPGCRTEGADRQLPGSHPWGHLQPYLGNLHCFVDYQV